MNVAHVPEEYQVPPLMMQPCVDPPVTALRVPLPENDPVAVGEDPPDVVLVGVEVDKSSGGSVGKLVFSRP